jgi:hypothetical protein
VECKVLCAWHAAGTYLFNPHTGKESLLHFIALDAGSGGFVPHPVPQAPGVKWAEGSIVTPGGHLAPQHSFSGLRSSECLELEEPILAPSAESLGLGEWLAQCHGWLLRPLR